MAQDELASVVDLHLELAVRRIEPAIQHLPRLEAALPEGEGARLLSLPLNPEYVRWVEKRLGDQPRRA
jgi:hypothetical protein